jgi:pimeloyl-ACP methyl ester carboxylesterase
MYTSVLFLSFAAGSWARVCRNLTIPITISSRNAVFNLQPPATELESTAFALDLARPGYNLTNELLEGYATINKTYDIAATYCQPDSGPGKVLQILTHGIGFDRSYWDFPYNNYNYSYVNQAVDYQGYDAFFWDRLGVGNSSHGDPINEIQASLEIAALGELTNLLASNSIPQLKCSQKPDKIVHVGHSFGSGLTYGLVNQYPNISDGIVLTGFSQVPNFMAYFLLGSNFVPVSQVPSLAESYQAGYIAGSSDVGVYIDFFAPGDFDPAVLQVATATGQPTTPGELLSLGSVAGSPNQFCGPVLIITGDRDIPFCGGNCEANTVINGSAPNLIAASAQYFKSASIFNATIIPDAGHGLNLGYTHSLAYETILNFLGSNV